jgi:hypothetical protein
MNKLKGNTKKLRRLAKRYQTNRNNQMTVPWDKDADCQAIFAEMRALGLRGCSSSCGLFTGVYENNKDWYGLNIGDNKIVGQKTRLGLFAWLDKIED